MEKKRTDEPEPKEAQSVFIQSGDAIQRDEKHEPVYKIAWESAQVRMDNKEQLGGTMELPKGTIYEVGSKPVSNFTSKEGEADPDSKLLTLKGEVVVTSLKHKVTLRCDEIRYASNNRRLVRALGNVRVSGDWGTVSGLNEVWATTDLSTFGTPDLFPKS